MPSILHVRLHGPAPAHPFEHANGLRALVVQWIAAVSPDHPTIAAHKSPGTKPYTISPLYTEGPAQVGFLLTLLDHGELAEIIPQGMRVRLGRCDYTRTDMPEIVEQRTWDELITQFR